MAKGKNRQVQQQSTQPQPDILTRLKWAAGDENTPRDVRELIKDAMDSIRWMGERVKTLEKAETARLSSRLHMTNLSPLDHERIDSQ